MNYFFKALIYIIISLVIFILLKTILLFQIEERELAPNVLDLAHRGYASIYEESSLEAFTYAIHSKTDGLEFDVRQTLDEVLVINHNRIINGIYIENSIFSDLNKSNNILRLKDILILAKRTNTKVWIEIKDSYLYPNIIENILELLKNESFENNTIIQSFNLDDLVYIHERNHEIKLLKLFIYYNNNDLLPTYIDYVGIPIVFTIFNLNSIKILHKLGFKVIVWRESSFFETNYILSKLISLGVDGFMINKPLKDFIAK